MAYQPFIFVHSGDFHLESPFSGVTDIPEGLADILLESPYRAAERVFQTVLAEEASFLVLCGDLLDPVRAGPRAVAFLAAQFERLAASGVPVYWAGGRIDSPDRWPSAVRLPDSVHVFPVGQMTEWFFEQGPVRVARLVGASRTRGQSVGRGTERIAKEECFSVAVGHGRVARRRAKGGAIDYWALGGRHRAETLRSASPVVHYAGSPQGRRPSHGGEHGCTVVRVDEDGHVRLDRVLTDEVRWLEENVELEAGADLRELEAALDERMQGLLGGASERTLLVSWTVRGAARLLVQLTDPGTTSRLLGGLRERYGGADPAAWSVSLEVDASAPLPSDWHEEDTVRGDFLRAASEFRADADRSLQWRTFLPSGPLGEELAAVVEGDGAERERIVRQAALLGAGLLSGEEPQS